MSTPHPPGIFPAFDTAQVVQRIRESLPELRFVGGAADLAAVQELRSFRTPACYVIFAAEQNTQRVPDSIAQCTLESRVEFTTVLAIRHWREQRGEQMYDARLQLLGALRGALIGWRPPQQGCRVIGWQAGRVLDYDAATLLLSDDWQVYFTCERTPDPDHHHPHPRQGGTA